MAELSEINKIKLRILEISYEHKLSHIGSCLTALPIIYECYSMRPPNFRFVLSSGHAGLALYCVLEHFGLIADAEKLLVEDGIHPVRFRNEKVIHFSTGSLGLGAVGACGIAYALPDHRVDVVCSDGEAAEGAVWEALRMAKFNYPNLHFHFNLNGFSALEKVDTFYLSKVLRAMHDGIKIHHTESQMNEFSFLKGVDAHYYVMNETDWNEVKEKLS